MHREEPMLPGEVTGCDGHPSAQRQRKMAKSLTGFLLQETFPGRFRRGWHDRKHVGKRRRQEQVEEAEASRRMREKARTSGNKQKNAGEAF